jgi:two-component system, NtrC family, response regulator AtoC
MSDQSVLKSVLVVDDEPSLRHLLVFALEGQGVEVTTADNGLQALEVYRADVHDVVLTDIRMPRLDGLGFTRRLLEKDSDAVVVVMSAYGDIQVALDALEAGAVDYLNKPFQPDEVYLRLSIAMERWRLRAENKRLRQVVGSRDSFDRLVAASESMQGIKETLRRVAPHRSSVLFMGESGTGKEVLARALHQASNRSDEAFVPINCGAVPEHLLESEFFGHLRGAFTDAHRDRKGLFDAASGGTLFLDEVGDLPLNMQVKMLRALQEGRIRPVGSDREHPVDVRVICATNADLAERVAAGSFREDLFYRLNTFTIEVPPLRTRLPDLESLVGQLLTELATDSRRRALELSPAVWTMFRAHPWPGNIRQLSNVLEAATVLCSGETIEVDHMPPHFARQASGDAVVDAVTPKQDSVELSIPAATKKIERAFIERALAQTGGNKTAAARVLEISPRALHYKIKDYGIE